MLIDEALELAFLGKRRTVRLERITASELPAVNVDPVQIQQVVLNLARNGLEAAQHVEHPALVVRTWREGDVACFSVADNGPGIPQEQMQTLFQAFRTESGNGMGIGLTISRTITQNHMGELVVDPGGGGRGACFIVKLPIALSSDTQSRDSAAAVPMAAAASAEKS